MNAEPHTTVRIWSKDGKTYANNGKGLNMEIHREPAPAVDAAAEGYRLGHADGFHSGLICGVGATFFCAVIAFVLVMVFA